MNTTPTSRLSFIGLALCAQLACAQTAPDAGLYQAVGGQDGIERISADFVPRLRADPQIGSLFRATKLSALQKQLVGQLCAVSGGPCVGEVGAPQPQPADLKIRKADLNALVEVLRQSMDAQGIPFGVQNRVLARLAGTQRETVNAR